MKKRILTMLMAAAMILSMAACGNGTEEKKTENSAETEAHLYMEVMITRVSIRQWMSMVRSIF